MSDTFVWPLPDGSTIDLTAFSDLPLSLFWQIKERQLNDMDATMLLLEAAASEDDLALLKTQPLRSLEGLLDKWADAEKVSLPES